MKKLLGIGLLCALGLGSCGTPGFNNPFTVPLTLQLTPEALTLAPGESANVAASVTTSDGIRVDATLGSPGAPGVEVTPNAAGFTVTVRPDATLGHFAVPVTATAGSGKANGDLSLTVQAPDAQNAAYTLSTLPTALTVMQGERVHIAVILKNASGERVSAALSSPGAAGIVVTPDQDGGGVTLDVGATTTAGTYTVPLSALVGEVRVQGEISVTVTVPQVQP